MQDRLSIGERRPRRRTCMLVDEKHVVQVAFRRRGGKTERFGIAVSRQIPEPMMDADQTLRHDNSHVIYSCSCSKALMSGVQADQSRRLASSPTSARHALSSPVTKCSFNSGTTLQS